MAPYPFGLSIGLVHGLGVSVRSADGKTVVTLAYRLIQFKLCLISKGPSNSLFYKNQSAYQSNYSCETALVNLTDGWLKEMDSGKFIGVILPDLNKAFDLVNYDILLTKLSMYVTSWQTMQWSKSYLNNCSLTYVSHLKFTYCLFYWQAEMQRDLFISLLCQETIIMV